MLTPQERTEAADALAEAERTATPIDRLTDTHPAIEVADAFAIQQEQIDAKVAAGAVVRGYKVGLSSRAMQTMMGVDEPDFGHLLDDMFVFEESQMSTASMCRPRVEFEVAFMLGRDLRGPGCTVADVLAATEFVMPAIEIIDSRFHGWDIRLCDTIADNASSSHLVLGARRVPIDGLDLRTLGVLVHRNGELIDTGAAGAVLGNPVVAVAWLANKLQTFGVDLPAGSVVLPGSCTKAHDVAAGDHITAEFATLGTVSIGFVE